MSGRMAHHQDAQIFNQSELKKTIENSMIGFLPADPLPQDDRPMPYFLLGDDAFALMTLMMKPFPQRNMLDEQRIFNYRLLQAPRIEENAFCILANCELYCSGMCLSPQPDADALPRSSKCSTRSRRWPASSNSRSMEKWGQHVGCGQSGWWQQNFQDG